MATTAATDRLLGDPVDFQGLFKVNVLLDCFDQQGPPFVLRTVRNATISGTLVITLNNLSAERDAISIVSFDLVGTLAAAWHDGSGAKSHNRTVATAPITLTPVNPDDPDTSVRRYRWRLKLLDAGSLCPSFSSKLATLAYEVRLVMLYNAVRKMRITSSKTWPVTLTESPYLVRTRIFTGIPSVLISTANKFDDVNQPMSLSPVSTNDASTTSSSSSSAPESPRSPTSPTLSFGSRRTSFLRLPDAALPTPPQSIAGSPPDSRRKSFVLSFKRSSANVSPKTSAGPPKRIPSSFLLKHRGIVAGYQIEGTLSWWYPSSHPTATPRLLDVALLCTIRISGVVSQRFVVGNDFKIEFTPEFKSRTSQRVGMIVPMDSVPSINHPLVHVSYDLSCKIYLDGAVKSSARILVPVQVLPRAKGARFGITSTPRSDSIRTATAQVEGEPTFNPDDPTGGERVETDDQAPNGDNISDQQPDGQLFEVTRSSSPSNRSTDTATRGSTPAAK
ncbi:hypothetical protein BJ742DRAFT_427283 [Cladochytrium replicatum]|nr:hypothetical protein BJ742DRAFT_427283 [Cladochytrium replicatum]